MTADERSEMSEGAQKAEQDWRLEAELEAVDTRGALRRLVGRTRSPEVVREIEVMVPHDVVITHDGKLLFAYAASEAGLAAARSAIENVLQHDGIKASLRVSHWDDELDRWRQTDPPATAQEKVSEEAADREADAIETRTVVATSGKVVRSDFERSMSEWADKLGLECQIVEHPHLLTTQVVFTVTGPRRKIDEFAQGLLAEGWAFIRADDAVMLSPL
jgi:tetrahydromethanopterin S-methyltransferase subunit H